MLLQPLGTPHATLRPEIQRQKTPLAVTTSIPVNFADLNLKARPPVNAQWVSILPAARGQGK